MNSIQTKTLEIYHTKGHKEAWAFWRMMNMDGSIFLGEIPSDEFINGDALANHIELYDGVSINYNTAWLKFILNGEVLFISKKTLRYDLSWDSIYTVGAVYGDSPDINFNNPTIVQNAEVCIDGKHYKVTLPKGANPQNSTQKTSILTGNNVEWTYGSEWNKLMYCVHSGDHPYTTAKIEQNTDLSLLNLWSNYSDYDLDKIHHDGNRLYNWCQETHGLLRNAKVLRGRQSVLMGSRDVSHTSEPYIGWRPVLRMIEN